MMSVLCNLVFGLKTATCHVTTLGDFNQRGMEWYRCEVIHHMLCNDEDWTTKNTPDLNKRVSWFGLSGCKCVC